MSSADCVVLVIGAFTWCDRGWRYMSRRKLNHKKKLGATPDLSDVKACRGYPQTPNATIHPIYVVVRIGESFLTKTLHSAAAALIVIDQIW